MLKHPGRRGRLQGLGGAGGRIAVVLALAVTLLAGCVWSPTDDQSSIAVLKRQEINALLDAADAAARAGDAGLAAELRATAEAKECENFGCRPALGTTSISMDPTASGDFFAMPWPSDVRRRDDGSIDLTGFPGRSTIPLANSTLGAGEVVTFGFGRNSGVFFESTAALAPLWFPTAEGSTHRRSPIMLLDLDHADAPPAPVLVDFKPTGGALRPANLLTVLPYPGHPLRNHTRYAAVVFDGLVDTTGQRLAPSPLLGALPGGPPAGVAPADWAELQAGRADTITAIRAKTLWHPSQLVSFTVFTTQDTEAEMAAITTSINASPAPTIDLGAQSPAVCSAGQTAHFTGHTDLPAWQEGTTPFIGSGGGIVIGPGGGAVQQGVMPVIVDVVVPCDPAPAGGWPILLFMDGTGGSADARTISELGANAGNSTHLPYLVLSIAPLFSGDRFVDSDLPSPELEFFNYFNPQAGRTNQLQQAGDMLSLKKAAQQLTLGPTQAGGAGHNAINHDVVVMAGHSQGALTLPITLSQDPTITGAFLSSGGAGFYHALAHRADIRNLLDTILGLAPGEFDIFHPVAQVLQTMAEVGDSSNYGAAVEGPHVLLYGGLNDGCSPIEGSVHLATTLGVPIAHQVTRPAVFGTPSLEPAVVPLPVSQNLPGGRTGVLVELEARHFGASYEPTIGRSFVDSLAGTGPVTENPLPLDTFTSTDCPRFDPAPTP